jgi:lipid-binding SYLF domain-containing protein
MRALAVTLFTLLLSVSTLADSRAEIERKSAAALDQLRASGDGVDELLEQAAGVLVFPDVVKMGFGVGGQYGEGVLLVKDKPAAYYATAGASFGLQLGAQFKAEVILFMNDKVLADFRNSQGWEAGVHGSVALVTVGSGGSIDTRTVKEPVIGFIFSNKGLMYNLTFEGSKITRIAR